MRNDRTDRSNPISGDNNDESIQQPPSFKKSKKVVLDERTTVEDIRALHYSSCRGLTVQQLNKVPSESCYGLTAECLGEMHVTNLSPACLMNVPWNTMEKLHQKTFNEMANSDAELMFFSLEDIGLLMNKFGRLYDKFPSTFVAYCTSDPVFAEKYIASLDANRHVNGLVQVFAAPYLERLDPSLFRFVKDDVLKLMAPITFRQLGQAQLARIPPAALRELTPAQFSSIPPAHFDIFTADSLFFVQPACLQAMTPQQARHLGLDPDNPPTVAAMGKLQRDQEIFARRIFIERHACVAVEERKQHFKNQVVWDALKARCEKVWNGYEEKGQMAANKIGLDNAGNRAGLGMAVVTISLIALIF